MLSQDFSREFPLFWTKGSVVEIGETGERKMTPSGMLLDVATLLTDLLWVCNSSSLLDKTNEVREALDW